MLSKNNRNELIKKQTPKRQRFTLKKLTIGVASVLIGFTFMGISASADETAQPANNGNGQANETGSDTKLSGQKVVLGQSNDQAKAQQSSAATNNNGSNAQKSDTSADYGTITFNPSGAVNPVTSSKIAEIKVPTTNSQDVDSWSSLINAVEDSNISTINLNGDITVDESSNLSGISTKGFLLNKSGIARDLTINGNHHTINFGDYFVKLGNKPQNGGLKWNVIFKDLNVEASGPSDGQYAPLYMGKIGGGLISNNSAVSADNQRNITVTLDGVNANLTGGRYGLISGHQDGNGSVNINNEYYHLVLQGNNTITSNGFTGNLMPGDDGDALSAGYITVENGTTTVTQNHTSDYELQYGGAAIRVAQPDKAGQYSIKLVNTVSMSSKMLP